MGHTVLIICRYEQNVLLKIFSKFWFINKTTVKVILVWNFDLRMFSVYGHEPWLPSGFWEELQDEKVKSLRRRRRWRDGQILIRKLTWAFGSGELMRHN